MVYLSVSTFSLTSHADEAKDYEAWYLGKNGISVQSFSDKKYYANLSYLNYAPSRFYIVNRNDTCFPDGFESLLNKEINLPEPFSINETFVKVSKVCTDKGILYFAQTEAGNDYIISTFKNLDDVVVRSYDGSVNVTFTTEKFARLVQIKALTKKMAENAEARANMTEEEKKAEIRKNNPALADAIEEAL